MWNKIPAKFKIRKNISIVDDSNIVANKNWV